MQLLVRVQAIITTPIVVEKDGKLESTVFIDCINRSNFTILSHARETLEEAVMLGKFNTPGIDPVLESIKPLIRQDKVYGELIEEFYLELTIVADKPLPEDLRPEPDCDIIQLGCSG